MNSARYLVALVLCAALLVSASAALAQDNTAAASPERIDTLKRIKDSGAITIGVREASVPFSYIDAQKQPQGYSIDLCLKIADAIKTELKMPRLDVRFLPVT
jgi:glutamate/aspartate transport system substrate-binding protein